MIKLNIDSSGRIYIPKLILESIHLNLPNNLYLDVSNISDKIVLYFNDDLSIIDKIEKRLNEKITKSEKDFLEGILNKRKD